MATSFNRWEKDPFFSAAEEVQESADRMESVYRQWIQERNFPSHLSSVLCKELQTALGTAKWQLEELERAVRPNDASFSVGESTMSRHGQFILAIENQISIVENSLRESNLDVGENSLAWANLDEGERDELAVFLSGPNQGDGKVSNYPSFESFSSLENPVPSESVECDAFKIAVTCEKEDDNPQRLLGEQPSFPPPIMLGFSGSASSKSRLMKNWYRNGFRKWKGGRESNVEGSIPLHTKQLKRGTNACYVGSKDCLAGCGDEPSDKQLDGWVGTIQRLLQRSQYQIQYGGRPLLLVAWAILTVLLIVLIVSRTR